MVEKTTPQVKISVNPELVVPKVRLDSMPLDCIIETKYNLVDDGGLSKEEGE